MGPRIDEQEEDMRPATPTLGRSSTDKQQQQHMRPFNDIHSEPSTSHSHGSITTEYPSPNRSPRHRNRIVYGDRYIPSRTAVNLQAAFSIAHDHTATPKPRRSGSSQLNFQRIEEANRTFSSLLKAELFGNEVPAAMPVSNTSTTPSPHRSTNDRSGSPVRTPVRNARSAPVTPNSNMLRYQSPSRSVVRDAFTEARGLRSRDITDTTNDIYSLSPVRMDSQRMLLSSRHKNTRRVNSMPYKVLDAPKLADDFYLNLVDWGARNLLAVGLGSTIYLWHSPSGQVHKLSDLSDNDRVTSVSWMKAGTHLAIGTSQGLVEIWDAEAQKKLRTMTGHESRAGSLAWNEHILTSGSRDRSILHRDVRIPDHYIRKITGHRQEVCGLKWNTEENQLASGSNDNRLFVWDGLNSNPLHKFQHSAAVKAVAWSPHQRGLLASGGGTADRRIRFWNTTSGEHLHEIDTGSQVCNLAWSLTSNEIVSTHGYSQNHVMVWKYPSMQHVAALTGHTCRVLYLAISPDGKSVVTGAGDETLRFWNLFDDTRPRQNNSSVLDLFQQLR